MYNVTIWKKLCSHFQYIVTLRPNNQLEHKYRLAYHSWAKSGILKPSSWDPISCLAPTLTKLTYLWFYNDPEDID